MKRLERKREERTREEIIKEFNDTAGRFDEFWAKLSKEERKKFTDYIAALRDY